MQAKLVSAKELVNLIGLSLRTVRDHTKQGLIPCLRFGDRVMYDVEAVLEAGRQNAQQRIGGRKQGEPQPG